jgi:hypothetical protein
MSEHLTEHCNQSCTNSASVPINCCECSDFRQLIVIQEETLVNGFLQKVLAILHVY